MANSESAAEKVEFLHRMLPHKISQEGVGSSLHHDLSGRLHMPHDVRGNVSEALASSIEACDVEVEGRLRVAGREQGT